MHPHRLVTVALGLLIAPVAVAQDKPAPQDASSAQNDLEYRSSNVEQDKKLVVKGSFESEWHELNNLDFRPLDETSDQAILDSDDRQRFAFTGLSMNMGYEVDEKTRFQMGIAHRGLWGNDQLGGTNVFGGMLFFTAANVEYQLGDNAKVTVGRRFWDLGGIAGSREYILADHLDGVWIDVPVGSVGTLTIMPINVVSASANPDDVQLIRYVSQSTSQSFNFRGDRMTTRYGAQLVLNKLADGLDVRAHAFYTDIGSLGTGSDISYNGRLGNFTDNDWITNAGARGSYEAGAVSPFATFDYSYGIDRKELVAGDVTTNGFAASGGLVFDSRDPKADERKGVHGEASAFYAQGPVYRSNGMLYNHGYVGLKARHAGGTLGNRYMGLHPTAYVGMAGVDDTQHDVARKSGTAVAHAEAGYTQKAVDFTVSYWLLKDTGVSAITDYDNIADPPYGYSRTEFAAEQRLGKLVGQEVDLDASYNVSSKVMLRVNGAVFVPGEFYAIPIGRAAGNQLGGTATAWAVNGGTSVRF